MRDKLFDNLAEVDKSLRRSYIAQISICLLFLYFSYNSIMVAGQRKDIDLNIADVKCAKSEYTHVKSLIEELADPDKVQYKQYLKELDVLAGQAGPQRKDIYQRGQFEQQQSYETSYTFAGLASLLQKHSDAIQESLNLAGKYSSGADFSKLSVSELTVLMRCLLPIPRITRLQIEQSLKEQPVSKERVSFSSFIKNQKVQNFSELLSGELDFLKHTCNSYQDIYDRINILERVKRQITELNESNTIQQKDLLDFEKSLKEKSRKLTETSIGSIKIPFTGQPLEIDLAFRLGPIVILLIQIFISAYFRHRFELVSMLNSTFKQSDQADKTIKEHIHLFLWPWVLNYPYFRSGTFKIEKQRGDLITKILFNVVQFLPFFTIAFIAIRPITLEWTGRFIGAEVFSWDFLGVSVSIMMLFLSIRQVLYARRLDSKVAEVFGWEVVEPIKVVATKPKSRLRKETIFVLLALGALLLNFRYLLTELIEVNFKTISPLLIIIAGLNYSKLRTNILTGIVVGCWTTIVLLSFFAGGGYWEEYFRYGLRFGPIVVPHASITGLAHLVLLGYVTVLFRQKTQILLAEADISWEHLFLHAPKSSTGVFQKMLRFTAVLFAIIISNLIFRYSGGMALLICFAGGCRLGPKSGAWAGGVAVFLSWVLNPVLMYELPDIFRFEYNQLGQIVTFALTGYLAGKFWLLIKQGEVLRELGAKLCLLPKKELVGKRIPFALLVFMLALSSSLYLEIYDLDNFDFLRFLLLPLPTVIIILLGIFYGHKKAVWSTGITLCIISLASTMSSYLGISTFWELRLWEGSVLQIGLNQWSIPLIAIWTLTAYVAGKIDLINDRRNIFRFALVVFVVLQLPGFIKSGTILSILTLKGRMQWFDISLITSFLQLLEPWFVMLLVSFFTKYRNGVRNVEEIRNGV